MSWPCRGRRFCRCLIGSGVLLVLGLLPFSMAHASAGAPGSSSACSVNALTFASPRIVPLDGYVNIKYSLRFRCPTRPRPYHVSFVVDSAAVGPDQPGGWAALEIAELPVAMSLDQNPLARAGVVSTDGQSRCALSNDAAEVTRCLAPLRPKRASSPSDASEPISLPEAIRAGAQTLAAARENFDSERFLPPREALLIAAAAPESLNCPGGLGCRAPEACQALVAAADDAAQLGVEIGVVCVSGNCSDSCLSSIATAGSLYSRQTWEDAASRVEDMAWSTEIRLARVTVRDILGSNMALNPDSIDPPENATYRSSDLSLQWTDYDVRGRDSVLFAYATTPIRPGQIQVSAFGTGTFVDTAGGRGSFTLSTADITAAREVLRVFTPYLYGPIGRELP